VWKKSEEETPYKAPEPQPSAAPRARSSSQATIGPSITIKGDLTGEEDLTIQGHVNGEIRLPKNKVVIGDRGRVQADVYGKSIHVDGQVKGNLYGEEDVIVRASGRVQGNIVGPRVTLENGANFKGSIDMEPATKTTPAPAPAPAKSSAPAASAGNQPTPPAAADKNPAGKPKLNPATSRG
jgi:cytoskeletal protein CcmA (bactofilin family)